MPMMVALTCGERAGQRIRIRAKPGSAASVPDSVPPVLEATLFSGVSETSCGPSPTAFISRNTPHHVAAMRKALQLSMLVIDHFCVVRLAAETCCVGICSAFPEPLNSFTSCSVRISRSFSHSCPPSLLDVSSAARTKCADSVPPR
jgi:hypothetical protein